MQAAAVALQNSEEQTVLLGARAFAREHLPLRAVASGDALGVDAVILLQRGFQLPEQAVVLGQDKCAGAGEWLGQRAQVFFLDEITVDHLGLGQLFAQLLQVEGVGQWGEQQGGEQQ